MAQPPRMQVVPRCGQGYPAVLLLVLEIGRFLRQQQLVLLLSQDHTLKSEMIGKELPGGMLKIDLKAFELYMPLRMPGLDALRSICFVDFCCQYIVYF